MLRLDGGEAMRRLGPVLGSLAILLNPQVLSACQCGELPSLRAAAQLADLVVEGEIVEKRDVRELSVGPYQLEGVTVARMRVDASWKDSAESIDIVTGFSDCDYALFEVGESYVVFGKSEFPLQGKSSGTVWAPVCWPTDASPGFAALTEALGPPLPRPIHEPPKAREKHSISLEGRTTVALGVSLVLIVIAGLIFLFLRRRK